MSARKTASGKRGAEAVAAVETEETSTDVATVAESGAVVVAEYADFAGAGFENQTQADYKIPLLNLLQAGSPSAKGEDAPAKAGMLMDTAAGNFYSGKTGIEIIPVTTEHVFVEWKPERGGFAGKHPIDSPVVRGAKDTEVMQEGKMRTKKLRENGNELVETFYIYAILCIDGLPEGWIIIPCWSTKIGPYKELMGRLRKFTVQTPRGKVTPPLFANRVRVSTAVNQKDPQGSYNFVFQPAVENDVSKSLIAISDPRFQAALECKKAIEAGLVSADMSKAEPAGGGSEREVEKDF